MPFGFIDFVNSANVVVSRVQPPLSLSKKPLPALVVPDQMGSKLYHPRIPVGNKM